MPTFPSNPSEEFSEVYQLYDWDKFYLDLLTSNSGDGLSLQQERCLRAIALDLDRKQIAEKLGIESRTVSDYLRKPYELIKMLFNQEGRMIEKKARSLILGKYSKSNRSQLSSFSFVQEFEANHEVDRNDNKEYLNSVNQNTWQTIDDVKPHVENFYKLCDSEKYLDAFYTIFDTDDYNNCVYRFLSSYGYLNTVIALYKQLTESWIPRKNEKWEFLTALACLGDAHDRIGNHEIAIANYQDCLEIALEIDDLDNIGGSLVNIGLSYYSLKNYEEALNYSRRGLEIAREIENREFEAHALNNLGLIYDAQQEYYLAIDYYHFSLEIKRKINDYQGEAGSLINIGNAHRQLKQYDRAIFYLQAGIEAAHQSYHSQFEANGWFNLALALESVKHYSEAILAYEKACILYQRMEMSDYVEESQEAMNQLFIVINNSNSVSMPNSLNEKDFDNDKFDKNNFDTKTSNE
ncbi:tetratricopeptide repeat protein [Nostoc sp. TCL26-01]|uniref:tetratricopeptide repeat protein n=1 Tax=Nostoc sp. TCL26-01 TaxID=2576904 RepID=UPI0015C0A3BD|nr:tetratricopeptide repeat protein [Nostoc sp. TCL26-01]QLE59797.1 tetratricopeptide repeat protein [Nostoc sp. TCL26-01]